MNGALLLMGIVIVICILSHRLTEKLAIPSLLVFLLLGMAFGEDGIFHIQFNDYSLSNTVCSFCLIFIMYYGGFGTNIKEAKPVAVKSVLLSTLGVVMTAGITGAAVHFLLQLSWVESLLIGSVIASTDAASVFHILRSKQLNLKDHTASLLELESGSNDPVSYMLTVVFTTLMTGSDISVPTLLFKQIFFGVAFGLAIGFGAAVLLRKAESMPAQSRTIFVFAIALIAYALPSSLDGNGYLSVYLCGILMGNSYIPQKKDLVRFFDVITGIAQMMIFFLLGLLVTPSELPQVFLPALVVTAILTLLARPLSVFALLAPFRSSVNQMGIVSWAGLRGVASIVFSIYAVLNRVQLTYDIFNLVFCVVLISMALQGTLLPKMSSVFRMIDKNVDVHRTFNDYQEESDVSFIKLRVGQGHPWAGQSLREITTPPDFLIVLLIRNNSSYFVPNGDTVIQKGDLLVIAAREFENRANLMLQEIPITSTHRLCGKTLKEAEWKMDTLVVLIKRESETIIPSGETRIQKGDTLVVARFDETTSSRWKTGIPPALPSWKGKQPK